MGEAKQKREATMRCDKSCGNCDYFRRAEPMQAGGVCRARPPTVFMLATGKHPLTGAPFGITNSYWPQTADVERCGFWARREPEDAAAIDLSRLDVKELEGNA